MPREMDCDFSRIKEIGVSSRLSVVKFNCLNERLILLKIFDRFRNIKDGILSSRFKS